MAALLNSLHLRIIDTHNGKAVYEMRLDCWLRRCGKCG
jgi:hypothetical protein